jgi:predicted transcriptional regulator
VTEIMKDAAACEKAVALKRAGKTVPEIMKALGRSQAQVYRYLKAAAGGPTMAAA